MSRHPIIATAFFLVAFLVLAVVGSLGSKLIVALYDWRTVAIAVILTAFWVFARFIFAKFGD